uniref:Probable inactive tRNA-specific adenosine deaminase-like protein 3 n=1 Tax=Phallusia mammillata TaxID=59560 RepID=A0A6F9D6I1_9ASCI|nr:probable inactive tRNA-specific adenosine deaminase-like protein 3 [Phallusia mammillata]
MEEPMEKKSRLDVAVLNPSTCIKDKRISCVLGDEYAANKDAVGLVKGLAVTLTSKKYASQVLKHLTEYLPLEGLQHLKRVRSVKTHDGDKLQVLMFVATLHEDFMDLNKTLNIKEIKPVKDFIMDPMFVAIPIKPPLTRDQFNICKQYWPVSFHEDKKISKLLLCSLFADDDMDRIEENMDLAIETARIGKKFDPRCDQGVVIVDPATNTIISTAFDMRNMECEIKDGYFARHPLNHAVMVAIDLVARSQGGGTYTYKPFLKSNSKINDGLYFNSTLPTSARNTSDTSDKGYYICTGLDVYVTKEPCIMCSMALLHSRVRCVFYGVSRPGGGLGSAFKLHARKDLNHRFEVFCNVLKSKCQVL